MKKQIIILCLTVFSLSVIGYAGDKGCCPKCMGAKKEWAKKNEKHMDKLTEKLGLNEKQREQVSGYMKKRKKEIKKECNNICAKIHKKYDKKIESVLTKEQMEKFKEMKGKKCWKKGGMHEKGGYQQMKDKMQEEEKIKEEVEKVQTPETE